MKLAFKFRKDAAREAPRRKPGKRAGGGLKLVNQAILIWLIASLGVLASSYYIQQVLTAQTREAKQARLPALADAYAERVASFIGQYRLLASRLAADPRLFSRLTGDPEDWSGLELELRPFFPQALRLRLLPTGLKETDASMSPPLGYACLDMLGAAEQKLTSPPVEVHMLKSEYRHIDIVQPVTADGQTVLGLLLVTLSLKELNSTVASLPVQDGYLELRQRLARGASLVVASKGDASLKAHASQHTLKVAGTEWELSAWLDTTADGGGSQTLIWAVVAASLLVIALALLGLLWPFVTGLRQDMAMVQRFFKDAGLRRLAQAYPARLAVVRDILGLLLQQARARQSELKERAEAEHGEATSDPLAKMMNLDDVGPDLLFQEPGDDHADEMSGDTQASIFRAYDIRGVVGENLDAEMARDIGRAVGSEAYERGEQAVIVARDGRLSSPQLTEALIRGLRESGRDVIDIGRLPTPLLYFATHFLGSASGVMVTGSHNTAEYNGFKIVLHGETLAEEGIQVLRRRIEEENFLSGEGEYNEVDVLADYQARISGDVTLAKPLKIVVDCGNGIAGAVAPELLRALGCEVTEMFCEVDGHFPNHHPDPSVPENLLPLSKAVREQGADLGLAFDGDGDRLGVIASGGEIIWPDRQMMLFARDVLSRNPNTEILYDIKSSRHLGPLIEQYGGKPMMWKSGHSLIKAKMKETGAILGGELSGHIFFKERWFGFDDAIYAAARLLEILAADPRSSQEIFAELPDSVNTPELRVCLNEGEQFRFMQRFLSKADFGDVALNTLDGLRVEFADGWGLIRASNTAPCLVLRFEADDVQALKRIQEQFRGQLLAVDPGLMLPF